MAENLHIIEKHGFPLSRKEASVLISEYVRRNGMTTPFKDDIPGKDWFYLFQKRNGLSIKKPQPVEIARRKACDPFVIYEYFDLLKKVVEELNLKDKPQQIYNLDETSICNDPVKGKIIGKKGFPATRTTSGPSRHNTTVLLATNACGDERPVLLVYDGHSTHVDLSVIEYAASQGITILKLPPHSSHILQPLDCSTMKPLKDKWEDELKMVVVWCCNIATVHFLR
ncbi:hypothetical protein ABMA28_009379 [Loxostege sticticalis]|uniref:DDE-1 domain-containing protein n=1 Tax=Loxostege sticticalis TaxID=481309 RepID=A0ABD0SGZ4_LOXSC